MLNNVLLDELINAMFVNNIDTLKGASILPLLMCCLTPQYGTTIFNLFRYFQSLAYRGTCHLLQY